MPKKHSLGFGNGKIIEHDDGSAGFVPAAAFTQAFRVPIAAVTSFSVTKGGKVMERTLNIHGSGTLLASASVPHGTSEKIEAWFRSHPLFGQAMGRPDPAPMTTQPPTEAPNGLIADELRKLAELRAEGVLTDDEFAAQKARLLGR